ncbi:hypothetical protein FRB94_012154 [Tulasnella sp. JGI-2019a]|nr:hypothetical protein FRB94_012154 [Tulasnella sp. JGI-2019a]KAG9012709.1 hypothetical protein FRB93_001262 [Tulasnella sp. JGI-2019a]KAG9030500.1 hypothetical protein FRB95_003895 [Tulasnella sp. JGI-2019a]
MAGHGWQAGFNPHAAPLRHRVLAQGLGGMMWFFIFYRARQDGGKLLGQHPWDAHGHGHDTSSAAHH